MNILYIIYIVNIIYIYILLINKYKCTQMSKKINKLFNIIIKLKIYYNLIIINHLFFLVFKSSSFTIFRNFYFIYKYNNLLLLISIC
jgi:hypothetical protein